MTWVTRIFQPVTITAAGGSTTILDNTVAPTVVRGMVFSYAALADVDAAISVWVSTAQGNTAWLINSMTLSPRDRVEWDVPVTLDVGDSIVATTSANNLQASVWGVVNE